MWFDNWKQIESDRKRLEQSGAGSSIVHVIQPTATVVFSHCSDESDPSFFNPNEYSTTVQNYTNYRTLICEHLIDSMNANDVLSLEHSRFDLFHQSTPQITKSLFYSDKDFLKNEISYYMNGYYVDNDITTAMRVASTSLVNDEGAKDKSFKRIVCITDKDLYVDIDELIASSYNQTWAGKTMDYYKIYKSVPIYFAYIGDISDEQLEKTNLQKIAAETGGKVYRVATLNELYSELGEKNHVSNVRDYDGDGFSDMEETYGLIVDSSGTRYKTKLDKDDSDDDGLKDNEEISNNGWCEKEGKDHYGNRIYKRYHHMNSDPTSKDSDGDEINDKEDLHPLSPYKLPFIDALKKMEKYVDEAKKNGVKALFHYSHRDDVPYYQSKQYNESNAVITMNIIRSIKYNGLMWGLTSGDSFNPIRDYINQKDPKIMKEIEEYKKEGKETFTDPDDNDVELLHMMATLSAYFDSNIVSGFFIDRELSGWAGDLQSMIYDIKIKAYGTDENLNEVALEKTGKKLTDIEKNLPSDQKKYVNTHFSMSDMLGDIDAENMYYLYHRNNELKLSEIFEDYYSKKKYYKTRFELFVNNYDGIENLEKATNRFTNEKGSILKPGMWITNEIRYSILRDNASEAADDKDVQERYEKSVIISSLVDKQNGYLKHALPEPQIITKEESDALTYGFVTFIRIHWNIERFG